MAEELKQTDIINLTEAERKTIKRFRISVFLPFIVTPGAFLIFAILLPSLLRHSPDVANITGEQFLNCLHALILISFLPLIIYYYKAYSLVRKYKTSTANPIIMLILFICSFFLIIIPWVFVIHLWNKSSGLLKEATSA